MPDIVIVGGGITGTAAAYWLAQEGHRPLLVEARSIAALGSGWSLGLDLDYLATIAEARALVPAMSECVRAPRSPIVSPIAGSRTCFDHGGGYSCLRSAT